MKASKLLLGIAVVAYVVSLVLPTVNQGQGIIFAVWGWVAFAMTQAWGIVWLANPAVVASGWLLFADRSPALRRLLAVAALLLALFALTIDEHGGAHQGVALQVGYWVWLGSIVILLAAVLLPAPHGEAAPPARTGPEPGLAGIDAVTGA